MSSEKTTPLDPQTSNLSLIFTLSGVAMMAGLLVALVYQLTLPTILENRRLAIERAIFNVIPNAVSWSGFLISAGGIRGDTDAGTEETRLYAGYDDTGEFVGVAMEAAAQGYQDIIRILYGYSPGCECITGINVVESKETPGLGDKIYKDAEFLRNFDALDGRLSADQSRLVNEIVTVKHGSKNHPWEIDAISGATVSSKAIGKMLNQSAQRMFPLVTTHLDTLTIKQDQEKSDHGS